MQQGYFCQSCNQQWQDYQYHANHQCRGHQWYPAQGYANGFGPDSMSTPTYIMDILNRLERLEAKLDALAERANVPDTQLGSSPEDDQHEP